MKSSAVIPASPSIVYALIADYLRGHPRILPRKYFEDLKVEEGGVGSGTRISFFMRSFGVRRLFRARITEPEPGRRLVETYDPTGMTTTFTVDGQGGGQTSLVTIATRYAKRGPLGWVERWLAPRYLRKVFAAELELLRWQARGTPASQPG
ncbi:MAG TPA: SRPBCC family protein [Gemmatimonadales bacterium]